MTIKEFKKFANIFDPADKVKVLIRVYTGDEENMFNKSELKEEYNGYYKFKEDSKFDDYIVAVMPLCFIDKEITFYTYKENL